MPFNCASPATTREPTSSKPEMVALLKSAVVPWIPPFATILPFAVQIPALVTAWLNVVAASTTTGPRKRAAVLKIDAPLNVVVPSKVAAPFAFNVEFRVTGPFNVEVPVTESPWFTFRLPLCVTSPVKVDGPTTLSCPPMATFRAIEASRFITTSWLTVILATSI
ncbi:hypothetical protein D3C75_1014450 [compost metagenome]